MEEQSGDWLHDCCCFGSSHSTSYGHVLETDQMDVTETFLSLRKMIF